VGGLRGGGECVDWPRADEGACEEEKMVRRGWSGKGARLDSLRGPVRERTVVLSACESGSGRAETIGAAVASVRARMSNIAEVSHVRSEGKRWWLGVVGKAS